MSFLTDEILMAYADSRLDSELRSAVEQMLVLDDTSRHWVALYKLSGLYVREAYRDADFSDGPPLGAEQFLHDRRHPPRWHSPAKWLRWLSGRRDRQNRHQSRPWQHPVRHHRSFASPPNFTRCTRCAAENGR